MNKDIDLDKIIDEYADMINKILYRKLRNNEDCEDLIQEIFIKYIKYIKRGNKFDTEDDMKYWLIRVALNLRSNQFKYNRIRRTVRLTENVSYNSEMSFDNRLNLAIKRLEKKYRDVFELFYIYGFKILEISEILKITESNVKTRLKRARNKIKDIISKGERINGRI